ncbi:hypothetical protein EDD11_010232 [Mortierella claussenii]|nr:hypothetical protein EDD11_010232 [Mortierella claussenii]
MDEKNNTRGVGSHPLDDMTQRHNPQRDTYGLPYPSDYSNSYNSTNHNHYEQDVANTAAAAETVEPQPYNDPNANQQADKSEGNVQLVKPPRERSKCLPCFPCIRSTCGRVTCCLFILLLIIIIVIVILVFAVFKMPTVDYLGVDGDPTYIFNQGNTTFGINMVANIQVKNPNPIGFSFESIKATAYYPGYGPSIGGGNITDVSFPSKSTKTIQFPVMASYDRHQDPGYTVVQDLLSKCGLLGSTDGKIVLNYDIQAKVKIIGISFSPSLKDQSTSFACPVDEDLSGAGYKMKAELAGITYLAF